MNTTDNADISGKQSAQQAFETHQNQKNNQQSFLSALFMGNFRQELIQSLSSQPNRNREEFRVFYTTMKHWLRSVDSDEIDRTGKIPAAIHESLVALGAFGMQIDPAFGGLGLSQIEYNMIMKLIASRDVNLTALISAHQTIALVLQNFGTEDQKKQYVPRLAKGAMAAFALSENDAGADPSKISASVQELPDGDGYMLNGEKVWTPNANASAFFVVIAKHDTAGERSAFIVDANSDGVEIAHSNQFMGMRALDNCVIRFTNVQIPSENLLWEKGKGSALAQITENYGRMALPACAAGSAKTCLEIARSWAAERKQWGRYLGHHESIAHKIANIAGYTFAMDAVADLAAKMTDNEPDIRMETAIAKLYNTEAVWGIIDDTLQIRSGRGYETAESQKNRGEQPVPVERLMRDWRISTIVHGSSEMMRVSIASEVLGKHYQKTSLLFDRKTSRKSKFAALPGFLTYYLQWYAKLALSVSIFPKYRSFGRLAKHVRFVERTSRKLARHTFHGVLRYGNRLEKRQAFLGRLVDIAAELFAITAVTHRAHQEFLQGNRNAANIADIFCRQSRRRIDLLFHELWKDNDRVNYKLGRQVLDKQFTWLEVGSAGVTCRDKTSKKNIQEEDPVVAEIMTSVFLN
ncbi:MAG: acyl-CoA dehydrogenase family protein [Calditrichia bacterium]